MRYAARPTAVHPGHIMARSAHSQRAARTPLGPPLSPRQRQVLALLDSGTPAREIAVRLGRSEATVRNHIRAVLRKLGCHSQLEAVATARRLGLLGPNGGGSGAA